MINFDQMELEETSVVEIDDDEQLEHFSGKKMSVGKHLEESEDRSFSNSHKSIAVSKHSLQRSIDSMKQSFNSNVRFLGRFFLTVEV
jgi:hypothetical protein